MPGAYAHLTVVNQARDTFRLETAGVPIPAILAVLRYMRFCELGAVSPDYPYLDLMQSDSKQWADLMHYERTGEPIKTGIEIVRKLRGEDQQIALAWLMGYAAHVVTDVTIHPVIERLVGVYAQNTRAHRECEMHQDAYIFQKMKLGEVGQSEHLDSGIWGCCDTPDSGQLHPAVLNTWQQILAACYPAQYVANEPDLNRWHRGFKRIVDKAEDGNRLPHFARQAGVTAGLTYPAIGDIQARCVFDLATPGGKMHYDAVFAKAQDNVDAMWALIGKAVFENDDAYLAAVPNCDLDTGRDKHGQYAYWPNAPVVVSV
jgi:hypothetical protein